MDDVSHQNDQTQDPQDCHEPEPHIELIVFKQQPEPNHSDFEHDHGHQQPNLIDNSSQVHKPILTPEQNSPLSARTNASATKQPTDYKTLIVITLNVFMLLLVVIFFVFIAWRLDLSPIGKKGATHTFVTPEAVTTISEYYSNKKQYYFVNVTSNNSTSGSLKCIQQKMSGYGTVVKICENTGLQIIVDILTLFAGITSDSQDRDLLRTSMDTISSRDDILTTNRLLNTNAQVLTNTSNILTNTSSLLPARSEIQLLSSNLMTYYFNHSSSKDSSSNYDTLDVRMNRRRRLSSDNNSNILWTNSVLETAVKNLTKEIIYSVWGLKKILGVFQIQSTSDDPEEQLKIRFPNLQSIDSIAKELQISEANGHIPTPMELATKCYVKLAKKQDPGIVFKCPVPVRSDGQPGEISILYTKTDSRR